MRCEYSATIFLVFTLVSALATLINALPTEIRHECEGSALCHIKPDGYPQDEIDSMVLKHLPQLQRMKRESPAVWVPDDSKMNRNCAVRIKENVPLYTVGKKGSLPEVVVQSKWFNQTITEVKCANDGETSGCFSAYAYKEMKTRCETKYMRFDLLAYDLLEKRLVVSPVAMGVDCACVIAEP